MINSLETMFEWIDEMDDSYHKIPIASVDLSGKEMEYVADALNSTWISSRGPYLNLFEEMLANLTGSEGAVATANGTVAIHLILAAARIGPGDEVIIPDLTYVATANAVRYCGATPVIVDVEPDTWCLDPQMVRDALTSRTRAILPVDLYGHPANTPAIRSALADSGALVIEDAAEAWGARYFDRPVGCLADAATFSFFGNKTVTTGEGGAVVTSNADLLTRMQLLRNQGQDPDRRYFHSEIGYNYRLTNVAAAIGVAQLERVERILGLRSRIVERYRDNLSSCRKLSLQPIAAWAEPSPWLFNVILGDGARSRDEVVGKMAQAGIETRPFFVPLTQLPMYGAEAARSMGGTPVARALGERGLSLPTYNRLSLTEVDRVCEVLLESV